MRYIGGKSKLAKQISNIILEHTTERYLYCEPFIGGASVFSQIAPHFKFSYGGDYNQDIAILWREVLNGWEPPESLTEAEYAELKKSEPSALRAFAGFGGSFGGKWFGGYARGGKNSDGSPRNHQGESRRAVLKIASRLENSHTTIVHRNYKDWLLPGNSVVYCDPPYADSQGYVTGEFNSEEFWQIMAGWADSGIAVFISEYQAPPGWDCIWEKTHKQSLTLPSQGREDRTERLFTRKPSEAP